MNAWLRPQHQVFSATRAMPANAWRICPAGPGRSDALAKEVIDVVESPGLHRRQAETCANDLRRDRSGTASTGLAIVSVHGRLHGRREHRSICQGDGVQEGDWHRRGAEVGGDRPGTCRQQPGAIDEGGCPSSSRSPTRRAGSHRAGDGPSGFHPVPSACDRQRPRVGTGDGRCRQGLPLPTSCGRR